MNRKILKTLQNLPKTANIAIATHDFADGDAITSLFLMQELMKKLGISNVDIYLDTFKDKSKLADFNFEALQSKTKANYDNMYDYFILLDTNSKRNRCSYLNKCNFKHQITIDHHYMEDIAFIDDEFNLIDASYGSCSELIWEILFKLLSNSQMKSILQNNLVEATMGVFTDNGYMTFSRNYSNMLHCLGRLEELTDANLIGYMMALHNQLDMSDSCDKLDSMELIELYVYDSNLKNLFVLASGWSSELKHLICDTRDIDQFIVIYNGLGDRFNSFADTFEAVIGVASIHQIQLKKLLESIDGVEVLSGEYSICKIKLHNVSNSEDSERKFLEISELISNNIKRA